MKTRCTVADVCTVMETIAPTGLAQSWDNVGLLAGERQAHVRRVLACIDLTPTVVKEALRKRVDLILAYHPPIFKPISFLLADSAGTDSVVFECVRHDIAIYAMHTALDAADGGTNDVIASLCGIDDADPLEWVDRPATDECKLVVFVPPNLVDKVARAMFDAGAGHIGDYDHCSYRSAGHGTFLGGQTTSPTLGKRGRLETVDEVRLEMVVPGSALPAVITAMVKAHSYEEPAFDVYPLRSGPVRGIGRIGKLPRPISLRTLARKLNRAIGANCVQIVGPKDRTIDRAIIVVGAAGSLPFRAPLAMNDVIVTGEIRHHDALAILRRGCTAIAMGHWASERPVLPPLADRVQTALPGITVAVSESDEDPFRVV